MPWNLRQPSPAEYTIFDMHGLAMDRERLPFPDPLVRYDLPWLYAPRPEQKAGLAMGIKLDYNLAKPPSCGLNADHLHNVTFDWETGQLRRTDQNICTCACDIVMWELSNQDRALLQAGMEAWEPVTEDELRALERQQEEESSDNGDNDATDSEVDENGDEDSDTNSSEAVDSDEEEEEEEGLRTPKPAKPQASTSQTIQPPSVSSTRVPKRARDDEGIEDRHSKRARQSEREASWSYIEYQEDGKTVIEIRD
ncbi:hypothetical protein K435DRAFT_802272 [Dendrothele bispora CBS 962.96]|uniref:Uncharacterized protein n=1 Tax=Dendrothele bispora (strain CBS 962.96) TaxID=1314807 RepID=A0A4S8LLK1_DENBC|nr:hypothetical protein K435DRAFT_802272 [Dendrothele bispora CBS 962.96]